MKAIKIILAVAVVAAIGFFVWKSIVPANGEVGQIPPPVNQFTMKIESEIDSLSTMPDNSFCRQTYDEIVYHISDDFQNGRMGKDESDVSGNEQNQEFLSKKLYAAYSDKFIQQAYSVFNNSEWDSESLSFIGRETDRLIGSDFLSDGPVKDRFLQIQQILSKHKEIGDFISACRSYSYSSNYRMTDRFPVSDMQAKINRQKKYLANNLDNTYVNNCNSLRNELAKVSEYLFAAHIRYLNGKINNWAGKYRNFNSQADYFRNLFKPLKDEIDLLDNDIYHVSSFDANYNSLISKLNSDNTNAYNYFNSRYN